MIVKTTDIQWQFSEQFSWSVHHTNVRHCQNLENQWQNTGAICGLFRNHFLPKIQQLNRKTHEKTCFLYEHVNNTFSFLSFFPHKPRETKTKDQPKQNKKIKKTKKEEQLQQKSNLGPEKV